MDLLITTWLAQLVECQSSVKLDVQVFSFEDDCKQ